MHTWEGGLLGIVPYRGVTRLVINNLIIELELETEEVLGPQHQDQGENHHTL